MNELTSLAKIDTSTLPEEDKIFNAIAKVTQEFGFPGVTLERVAQKLGLAKSSLYTYFSNKKDMIKDLALKEMSTLINIIHEKVLLGKDFSEQIFLHLQSEFNYFKKRNSLISVFGWLSIQGAFNKEKALKIIHLHSKEKYKNKYDHRWLSVLVVAV
jgi:AcrR family transcriptional regulator